MNNQILEQARGAYRAGDFVTAAQLFSAAKESDKPCGEVDHLRGNALMRIGRYPDAAEAYFSALADTSYGKQGALFTNRGKALAASGDLEGAAESFTHATQDASYATPYKAYLGLGSALQKLGRTTEAGVAYRRGKPRSRRSACEPGRLLHRAQPSRGCRRGVSDRTRFCGSAR